MEVDQLSLVLQELKTVSGLLFVGGCCPLSTMRRGLGWSPRGIAVALQAVVWPRSQATAFDKC
jgi:hypothetical protein